jgi:hypothetical protein
MDLETVKSVALFKENFLQAQMEKNAVLGAVGKGAMGLAKGLGRGAAKHPLAAGFAYVSLAPEKINPLPILRWPLLDRMPKQQKEIEAVRAEGNAYRASGLHSATGQIRDPLVQGPMSKKGSAMYTLDEVKAVQRLSSRLEKVASAAPAARLGSREVLKKVLQYGGIGLGLGVGAKLGDYGISSALAKSRTRNERKYYNNMMKIDPGLRKEPGAREMFRVVNRASPYLASEPIIAAATVRSMLESPALDERKLQQLLTTEKLRQETEIPWSGSGRGMGQMPKDLAMIGLGS